MWQLKVSINCIVVAAFWSLLSKMDKVLRFITQEVQHKLFTTTVPQLKFDVMLLDDVAKRCYSLLKSLTKDLRYYWTVFLIFVHFDLNAKQI